MFQEDKVKGLMEIRTPQTGKIVSVNPVSSKLKNMVIKLNLEVFDYLVNKLLLNQKGIKHELKINKYPHYIFIELNADTSYKIRELAMDRLQIVGFDIKYNLTEEGKILEDIIDLFYIQVIFQAVVLILKNSQQNNKIIRKT